MHSSSLLVLGATGQVGKLVAKSLRKSAANFSVGTRRAENLQELADQFGASRFIDLDDPRTFDKALKGITGLFLLTGYTVDMLVQSKSLIDAAKPNGSKATPYSRIRRSNQRMQREDSNCSTRSRTEEWHTSEVLQTTQRSF